MRSRLASLLLLLPMAAAPASGQSCTGLCLQQVSCPNGGVTTLSGVVYAPNGIDPLPNILVYIPNEAVSAFVPGVSCAVAGQPPSGSPLAGTTTAVDGSFTLTNVPVGSNIPLVVQSGRWRRQIAVPATTACADTSISASFPQNQSQGDIPKIAVVTGNADAVECVLRKVGLNDTEFTDASGSGRVNLYTATGSPGAQIDLQTPNSDALLGSQATLNGYDVLMLPCEGVAFPKEAGQLSNLVQYANAGGRVYASHFSYDWLFENAPFNTVANWAPDQPQLPNGTATIDTGFVQGQTLAQWLADVGASTAPGQISISTLRHDLDGVNAPTQTWLTLNDSAAGNPVMQFTFDTPVNATSAACGRVLFNEYHVENPIGTITGLSFPAECLPGAMTAQEKLLEFSLFDLTGSGNPPSLSPLSGNFGTEAVGFPSTTQRFLWTNNTVFPVLVSSVAASGDFSITANTCASVAVGASCEIDAEFLPTAVGARAGSLTVVANTNALSAALSGNGVSPLAISAASLTFGKADVGSSVSQTLTLSNSTPTAIALPAPTTSGDFSTSTSCGATLGAGSSCTVTVVFTPSATGSRMGMLNVNAGVASLGGAGTQVLQTLLSGTGVDFALALGPGNGQTIAGISAATVSTTSPIAGFANAVTLACTTTAPASTCSLATSGFTPDAAVADAVTITTTSQYTVVGYAGFGAPDGSVRGVLLCLFAAGSAGLLSRRRGRAVRLALVLFGALLTSGLIAGCTGKDPGQNTPYTPAGTYSYTVSATDGFLKHSATYTLVVTAK